MLKLAAWQAILAAIRAGVVPWQGAKVVCGKETHARKSLVVGSLRRHNQVPLQAQPIGCWRVSRPKSSVKGRLAVSDCWSEA